MICHFCDKETNNSSFSLTARINIEYCCSCKAEYVYIGKALWHCNLYTVINSKLYLYCKAMCYDTAFIDLIKNPGIVGLVPNKDRKRVIYFSSNSPIITPSNINEKLKTFVLLS